MYNVHVGLTNACNLNCNHCYVKRKGETISQVVNEDLLIDIIDRIGSAIVTYTCGENLLYENFNSFAKRVNKKRLYQILISNGVLINSQSIVQDLENCGINQINISLDSSNSYNHDKNRGMVGTFDAAINALKLIADSNNITPLIATSVSNVNLSELLNILLLGQELGVKSFSFIRERNNFGMSEINDNYYNEMEKVISYSYNNDLDLHIHDFTLDKTINDLYHSNRIDKAFCEKLIDMNNCHIYKKLILITPCGNVYPCVFSSQHIGNIYTDSLANIFERKEYISFCKIEG